VAVFETVSPGSTPGGSTISRLAQRQSTWSTSMVSGFRNPQRLRYLAKKGWNMRGVNQCTFIGNVTRDIELRETTTGSKVATFGVAVNRQWKNKKTNEVQEDVEFINVVAWDSLGEVCFKFLTKGSPVYVQGRLATRKYTDKNEVERYITEIIAQEVNFLPSPRGTQPTTPAEETAPNTDYADLAGIVM